MWEAIRGVIREGGSMEWHLPHPSLVPRFKFHSKKNNNIFFSPDVYIIKGTSGWRPTDTGLTESLSVVTNYGEPYRNASAQERRKERKYSGSRICFNSSQGFYLTGLFLEWCTVKWDRSESSLWADFIQNGGERLRWYGVIFLGLMHGFKRHY